MLSEAKVVILDFGRVLGLFDIMKTCRGLAEFCDYSPEEISSLLLGSHETRKTEMFEKLEKGLITPAEFYRTVILKLNANDLLYSEFYIIWGNIFSPSPEIENLLARLRPHIFTLVLSNTDCIRWGFMRKLSVMRRFFAEPEQLILSFQVYARKPDPKIYLEAVRRSGAKPKEIIYVDDVPEFVEAARNLGMTGILYNCAIDPIDVLEKEFSKYGVI